MGIKFLLTCVGLLVLAAPVSAGDSKQPVQTIAALEEGIQREANDAHRYDLYAKRADQEGYEQVARLFRAAAVSERIHRRNHEAVLCQLGVQAPRIQPQLVRVGSTRDNLRLSIQARRLEAAEIYPTLIGLVEAEGVPSALRSLLRARDAHAGQLALFQRALDNLGRNPKVIYHVESESGLLVPRLPGTPVAPAPEVLQGEVREEMDPRK